MPDRILTTHVGSLPRPTDVSDMLFSREAGQHLDPAAFDTAVAAAVRDVVAVEFRGIVDAGLVRQVDSPDLALARQTMYAHLAEDEFVHRIGAHVAALNAALDGIPEDRVRLHLCWGHYEGPHTMDVAIARLLPAVLGIYAEHLSFEGANPRHAHEWRVGKDVVLPEGRRIIPGLLDGSTNYVEHPDLVAKRLLRYAGLVGRDRVLAGSDCGFSTFAGSGVVDPDIVWMKLGALAEGARRASDMLWRQ